jgi:putative transposase
MAETKKDAFAAFDAFVETWGVKYDKAVESSRPNIGSICARPTSSKARSRPSVTARCARRDVSQTRLRSPSGPPKPPRKPSAGSRDRLPKIMLGVRYAHGIDVIRLQAQGAAPDPFHHQDSAIAQLIKAHRTKSAPHQISG